MHQYIESVLPYVYLVDGYRLEDGPYGETLAVEDVDALHRVIARWIAGASGAPAGPEGAVSAPRDGLHTGRTRR